MRPAVILAYHRVVRRGSDFWGICAPPDTFRAQMEIVRRECRPLPLEELAALAAEGEIPERAVAVTLDDGYVDSIAAAKILGELGIPATFFVTTAGLEARREYWWDTLERVFAPGRALPSRLDLRIDGEPLSSTVGTGQEREDAMRRLHGVLLRAPLGEREEALGRLLRWSGAGPEPCAADRPMTADELRELAGLAGVSVGCHGENHLALTGLAGADLRREVSGSKARLEGVLGRRASSFAYPFGAFDEAAVGAVRAAGFTTAVTTRALALDPRADPLALPRFEMGTRGGDGFAAWLKFTLAGEIPAGRAL